MSGRLTYRRVEKVRQGRGERLGVLRRHHGGSGHEDLSDRREVAAHHRDAPCLGLHRLQAGHQPVQRRVMAREGKDIEGVVPGQDRRDGHAAGHDQGYAEALGGSAQIVGGRAITHQQSAGVTTVGAQMGERLDERVESFIGVQGRQAAHPEGILIEAQAPPGTRIAIGEEPGRYRVGHHEHPVGLDAAIDDLRTHRLTQGGDDIGGVQDLRVSLAQEPVGVGVAVSPVPAQPGVLEEAPCLIGDRQTRTSADLECGPRVDRVRGAVQQVGPQSIDQPGEFAGVDRRSAGLSGHDPGQQSVIRHPVDLVGVGSPRFTSSDREARAGDNLRIPSGVSLGSGDALGADGGSRLHGGERIGDHMKYARGGQVDPRRLPNAAPRGQRRPESGEVTGGAVHSAAPARIGGIG